MKRLLKVSLLVHLLTAAAIGYAIHRLGGCAYTLSRLRNSTTGVYQHRIQHFERLDEQPGSIIFLGDSQVAQAEWHELFAQKVAVLKRGTAAECTLGVMGRLPEILRHKPLKIFLLVGVNDLIFGQKPADIARVYRRIVQKIRTESPDSELYLQWVLPVNNALRNTGTTNAEITVLNAQIAQIARDFALPFVDLATPLQDADGNLAVKFSQDGLHLNGAGYAVWKKAIQPYGPSTQ